MSSHKTNIIRIKTVANALGDLNKEVIYVGGAVVSLYIQNPELASLRVTDDVDVVIQIEGRGQYMQLQEKLRELGFTEDAESGVICRWNIQGITVDIMPDDADILGFSNRWYTAGIANKQEHTLDDLVIYKFTPPYFIASKLEALYGRPEKYDWRWSQDFEDILKVSADIDLLTFDLTDDLAEYFKQHFTVLVRELSILEEAIAAHLIPPFYTDLDVENISQRFMNYATLL